MTRRFLGLLLLLVGSLAGCTTCSHKAGYLSLSAEPGANPGDCSQRQKVYTILINGFDPLYVAHIDRLAKELNSNGYAKVYTGEFFHQAFLEKEIRRVHSEDPEARFVVVGYSIGAGVAVSLTTRLVKDNIPIDALIEVAPVYLPLTWLGQDISTVGRHIVIGQNWQDRTYSHDRTEALLVPKVGHYSMPTHPATVGKILDLLKQSTTLTPKTETQTTPTYPLVDDPAPIPTGTILP
jgi:hypothetical protein